MKLHYRFGLRQLGRTSRKYVTVSQDFSAVLYLSTLVLIFFVFCQMICFYVGSIPLIEVFWVLCRPGVRISPLFCSATTFCRCMKAASTAVDALLSANHSNTTRERNIHFGGVRMFYKYLVIVVVIGTVGFPCRIHVLTALIISPSFSREYFP